MTIEVRYVIFSPEETRKAIAAFMIARGYCTKTSDIAAVTPVNEDGCPSVMVGFNNSKDYTIIESTHLISAFLLFCKHNRTPVPRLAEKRIEISRSSFILVLTTDRSGVKSPPVLQDGKLSYGTAAAIHEVNELKLKLARALESVTFWEKTMIEMSARLSESERTNAELSGMLTATGRANARLSAKLRHVVDMPGVRGIFGRGLLDDDIAPNGQG
jgi:uncharacterized coiled-coil protein SlyX